MPALPEKAVGVSHQIRGWEMKVGPGADWGTKPRQPIPRVIPVAPGQDQGRMWGNASPHCCILVATGPVPSGLTHIPVSRLTISLQGDSKAGRGDSSLLTAGRDGS